MAFGGLSNPRFCVLLSPALTPETAHAIRVAIDEALLAKQSGEKKVIAFNPSGHGHFDMTAYDDYMQGKLNDYDYPQEAIDAAMSELPEVAM